VTETAPERSLRIVGREAELRAMDEFMRADGAPGALVLTGGPGIGKTTLWEAGVELARRGGLRVLSARGSDSETQLSFAAIIDLLDGVDREELGALPSPQLHALEAGLLRAEPSGDPPPPAAISVGFLSALRALAAQQPLLLAVDDVQWLDAASAEAVAFAVRRLDGHPVRFLFAKRSRTSSMLERAYGPKGLHRIEVVPLSLGATQRLLRQRLALSLSRHVLRRVVEATLGNPLFALELGRGLAARGPLGIGEDVPLPDTVEELLGTRVGALAAPARRLVLAVALSGELRTSQLAEIGPPAALDDALDSGVLVVDGERVRPAHPLFATAARTSAGVGVRRELHLVLAQLATDDESNALHLALATDRPDAELAATVAAAAAGAASRGARHKAVLLAEHALRLTHDSAAERSDRVLTLGGYLVAAGEKQRLTELLSPEVETLPRGAPRVQALLLLTEGVVGTNDEIRSYLLEALQESGSDAVLRASVLVELVVNDVVIRIEGIPAAEASALEALEVARGAGPDLERPALQAVGWARALRGRAIDDLLDRFRAAASAPAYMAESPERVAGQRLVWRGEIEQARALLTPLLELADERRESYSYALQRLHLCQLELRVGNWDAVGGLLDEWAESWERVMWPMYERCRALLAAGRGLPDEAERWAAETLARAEATGTQWDRLEALRARAAPPRCWRTSRHGPRRACAPFGSTHGARGSTIPACSRSRPSSWRRWSRSGSSTRQRRSPPGCASWRRRRTIRGGSQRRSGVMPSCSSLPATTRPRRRLSNRRRPSTAYSASASTGQGRCSPSDGASAGRRSGARRGRHWSKPWPSSTNWGRPVGRSRRAPSSPASAPGGHNRHAS
jgi:AAA ATPase domain